MDVQGHCVLMDAAASYRGGMLDGTRQERSTHNPLLASNLFRQSLLLPVEGKHRHVVEWSLPEIHAVQDVT